MKTFASTMQTLAATAALLLPATVYACPFCSTGSKPPITNSVLLADLTAVARVQKVEAVVDYGVFRQQVTFQIERVLRQADHVEFGEQQLVAYGTGVERAGQSYLICANLTGDKKRWTVVSSWPDAKGRLAEYLDRRLKLAEGDQGLPERVSFLASHLEHQIAEVREDAVAAFQQIKIEWLVPNKQSLPVELLRAWVVERGIPEARRQLYAFLLGLAGNPDDAKLLHDQLERWRRMSSPAAIGFFTGYALADDKAGLEFLQGALKDAKAEPAFRTHALYALPYLELVVEPAKLRQQMGPTLIGLLDDDLMGPQIVNLWTRTRDTTHLDAVRGWYEKQHAKLGEEMRRRVANLASETSGPAADKLIASVRKLDPSFLNDPDEQLATEQNAQPQ